MARKVKNAKNLQAFRGAYPKQDVYAKNSGFGCTPDPAPQPDKLACRVRFDNALAHVNPLGGVDQFVFPQADGFAYNQNEIINHINAYGVGAEVSVIAIPTYAILTGLHIHIAAEEPGLTFGVKTRNGLALPTNTPIIVTATDASQGDCPLNRERTDGTAATWNAFGALGSARFIDIIGRDGTGKFALEADEIILEVKSMPSSGVVLGDFQLVIRAAYEVIGRAEA